MPVEILDTRNQLKPHTPLWRYMSVSAFFLLLEGDVFFPSIAALQKGDPLEGGLGAEPPWLVAAMSKGDSAEAALDKWLWKQAKPGECMTPGEDIVTAGMNSRLIAKIYMRELAMRRAAWCWFASHAESAAMWKVYGSNGISVATTLGALRDSLPSAMTFQVAPIRYVDRRDSARERFDPSSQRDRPLVHRPHLLKAIEYDSEKEVRITTKCSPGHGKIVRGISTGTFIDEIVFSPLMPREEARALARVFQRFQWKTPPSIRRSCLAGLETHNEDLFEKTSDEAFEEYGFDDEEKLPPFLDTL